MTASCFDFFIASYLNTLDASGRFIMPAMLRDRAKIGDLAFFIGTGYTFEIWNPRLLIETPGIAEELKEVVAYLLNARGVA